MVHNEHLMGLSLVGGVVVADHLGQDPLLVSVHGLHPRRHLVALFGHVIAAGRGRPAQRGRADTERSNEVSAQLILNAVSECAEQHLDIYHRHLMSLCSPFVNCDSYVSIYISLKSFCATPKSFMSPFDSAVSL